MDINGRKINRTDKMRQNDGQYGNVENIEVMDIIEKMDKNDIRMRAIYGQNQTIWTKLKESQNEII